MRVVEGTDAPHRSDRQIKTSPTGWLVVLFTIIAAPILALSAYNISSDRANVDAYDAAPVCTTASTAACKQQIEYRLDDKSELGKEYYLSLITASGSRTRVQVPSLDGMWSAPMGDAVTVTSWHGEGVFISDGRRASQLTDSPIHTGEFPYCLFWITAAIYAFFVLLVLIPASRISSMTGPFFLVAGFILVLGIALHGWIIGGPWYRDFLLWAVGVLALGVVVDLLPTPRRRRGRQRLAAP